MINALSIPNERSFPLGLAYIASFIQQRGYEVSIFDINFSNSSREEVVKKIAAYDFDCVGISALVTRYNYVEWLVKEIKRIKDVPIAVGNGLGTGAYHLILKHIPEVDFCVLGEGEEAFLDILENYPDTGAVEGIAYRGKDKEVIVNPKNEYRVDVNDIPWPAYGLFDMDRYFVKSADFLDTGYFTIRSDQRYLRKMAYMITARGCPYHCKFCGKIIGRVRLRKIPDVVKEIRYLKEKYNIGAVTFYDELLMLNKDRTMELAEAFHEMGILWSCQGRVGAVDPDLLRRIKDCGCVSLGYGIESGSQEILDAMDKRATVKEIFDALKAAQDAGLQTKVQLIFGYPGENRKTIKETVELFKKLRNPGRRFAIIRPLPGSRLYDELLQQGVIENELEYIKQLDVISDMNLPVVNLTAFKDDEIKLMACRTEGLMLFNYLIYMALNHPVVLIRRFKVSRGSYRIVMRYLAKLLLSYFKPLFKSLLNRRCSANYRIYANKNLAGRYN